MQGVPGLSIATTAAQSASGMFEAMSQRAQFKGAARADEENARLSLLQAAVAGEDIRRRGRATQGEAIAALADGGDASGMSAQDLIFQNSLEIEYAAMNARYSGAMEARGYKERAAQERSAARAAIIGGVMRAGAAAITGYSNMRSGAASSANAQARYDAYFPGGQRMPVPSFVGPR